MSIPFVFYTTEIGVDVSLSSDPLVFTFGVDSLPGNLVQMSQLMTIQHLRAITPS